MYTMQLGHAHLRLVVPCENYAIHLVHIVPSIAVKHIWSDSAICEVQSIVYLHCLERIRVESALSR